MSRPVGASILLALLALTGCSSADPPMTRSCRGEYVNECRPYTYARITSATLTPSRIALGDSTMHAMVHVEFARCDMAPLPLFVQVSAFVGGTGDASIPEPGDGGGSSGARVIPLTMIGPADAGATSMDVTIPNPFFTNVPADTDIALQFEPVIDDCGGEVFSLPYHTGTLATMP